MILVVGDRMIDRYIWADVTRISPEAPVPVAKVIREEERQGGAANVLQNVAAMGAEAIGMFSASEDQVRKIRVVGKNQQMLRLDYDSPQQPIRGWMDIGTPYDVVIFSDYGKGALANVQDLIERARQDGATVLVDPKGHDYTRYRNAHLVKPNTDEMKELVGGWSTEEQLAEKVQKFRQDAHVGAILLTRAAAGMTLFTDGGATHIPAAAKEVYDVSGAGDTAIAAFAVALTRGCSYIEAAHYANKAAGIVVGRFGTAVATKEEVFG